MSESLPLTEANVPGRTASKCMGLAMLAIMCFFTWGLELARAWFGEDEFIGGRVTLNGWPLAGASVTLHPQGIAQASFITPRDDTAGDGTFKLQTARDRNGSAIRRYAVTVQMHEKVIDGDSLVAGPNILPDRYASPRTTPLAIEVSPAANHFDIELNLSDEARIVAVVDR